MSIEVRVAFVGTEGAVIGMGPTEGLLWVAGKFSFLICAVVTRALGVSCFIKLHMSVWCSISFCSEKVRKTSWHTQIGSGRYPVKTLHWPRGACKEKLESLHMVGKALQHRVLHSKLARLLRT